MHITFDGGSWPLSARVESARARLRVVLNTYPWFRSAVASRLPATVVEQGRGYGSFERPPDGPTQRPQDGVPTGISCGHASKGGHVDMWTSGRQKCPHSKSLAHDMNKTLYRNLLYIEVRGTFCDFHLGCPHSSSLRRISDSGGFCRTGHVHMSTCPHRRFASSEAPILACRRGFMNAPLERVFGWRQVVEQGAYPRTSKAPGSFPWLRSTVPER